MTPPHFLQLHNSRSARRNASIPFWRIVERFVSGDSFKTYCDLYRFSRSIKYPHGNSGHSSQKRYLFCKHSSLPSLVTADPASFYRGAFHLAFIVFVDFTIPGQKGAGYTFRCMMRPSGKRYCFMKPCGLGRAPQRALIRARKAVQPASGCPAVG